MHDTALITVANGKGGDGCISGRREAFVPRGGPDGGDGGDGGSITLYADPNVSTLIGFRYNRRFVAGDGGHGKGSLKHGRKGRDVEIAVPIGTSVISERNGGTGVADLTEAGQRVMVARGGRGGRGNARFASPTNRFPLLAEKGEESDGETLRLELKVLADVGIIGSPNAGKSSLLAAISRARPKIASYPFTTIEPVLGVAEHRRASFVVVDIPGLIEGAHRGAGLGYSFLRHVERARVLLHVVDGSLDDVVGEYRKVNDEIGQFNAELTRKRQVVAVNKIDIPEVREMMPALKAELQGAGGDAHAISAVTREGLDGLLDAVLTAIGEAHQDQEPKKEAPLPVIRPGPRWEPPEVLQEEGVYVVKSAGATRIAAMVDETDWSALSQFMRHLRKTGVLRALEQAGIKTGDTVRVGKIEWEWE